MIKRPTLSTDHHGTLHATLARRRWIPTYDDIWCIRFSTTTVLTIVPTASLGLQGNSLMGVLVGAGRSAPDYVHSDAHTGYLGWHRWRRGSSDGHTVRRGARPLHQYVLTYPSGITTVAAVHHVTRASCREDMLHLGLLIDDLTRGTAVLTLAKGSTGGGEFVVDKLLLLLLALGQQTRRWL